MFDDTGGMPYDTLGLFNRDMNKLPIYRRFFMVIYLWHKYHDIMGFLWDYEIMQKWLFM